MGDSSTTYSGAICAYGTLEPNLIEGIKGLNYITGGIRPRLGKKFEEQNGQYPRTPGAALLLRRGGSWRPHQPRQQHRPQVDPAAMFPRPILLRRIRERRQGLHQVRHAGLRPMKKLG
jgi:hypothetical protein